MKKIFILIFVLFTTSLMAASSYPTYELLVNTPQEVGMYAALLENIHFFFNGETGDNYRSLLRVIVLFGTILTVVKVSAAIASGTGGGTQSLTSIASYQIFVVFMLITLFGKQANIVVRHPQSLTFQTSPLIPDIFAYTISFFSGLNYNMTKIAERSFSSLRGQGSSTAYSSNDYSETESYGMTGIGYAGLPTLLAKVPQESTIDKLKNKNGTNIAGLIRAYQKDCLVMPVSADNPLALSQILNSNDFLKAMSPASIKTTSNVDVSTLNMKYGIDTYENCKDGYDDISTFFTNLKHDYPKDLRESVTALYYLSLFENSSLSGGTFSSNAPASALTSASAVSQDTQISAALNLSALNVYKDLGNQGVIAASGESAALTDLQQNGSTMGMFMARYLPIFSSFIYMIMIAAFPFMFAFALMPGGFQIMVQFAKTLAWISLWSPMAAILNFFIDYRMTERIKEVTNGVISAHPPMSQLVEVGSEAALMAGLAGYLYMMVPALSWMLVTGSGVMLSNITSSLGGAFQKHGNSEAVQEAGVEAGSAKQANTSIAEMKYYQSGAKMAQESSTFRAQNNVYGDDFKTMGNDMAKMGTMTASIQRGNGSMMTMTGASDGGLSLGKMDGAKTQATGVESRSLDQSDYRASGDVAAGKMVGEVKGSKKVLKEHGGTDGLISDTALNNQNLAMQQHTTAQAVSKSIKEGSWDSYKDQLQTETSHKIGGKGEAREKALETSTSADIDQGLQNQQNKIVSGLAGSGSSQNSDQSSSSGYQSSRQEAITENATAKDLKKESNERLKKTADVLANKQVTSSISAVNDSGVSIKEQKGHDKAEAIASKMVQNNKIKEIGGDAKYETAMGLEATHEGAKIKRSSALVQKAIHTKTLDTVVKTELASLGGTVDSHIKMKKHEEKTMEQKEKKDEVVNKVEAVRKAKEFQQNYGKKLMEVANDKNLSKEEKTAKFKELNTELENSKKEVEDFKKSTNSFVNSTKSGEKLNAYNKKIEEQVNEKELKLKSVEKERNQTWSNWKKAASSQDEDKMSELYKKGNKLNLERDTLKNEISTLNAKKINKNDISNSALNEEKQNEKTDNMFNDRISLMGSSDLGQIFHKAGTGTQNEDIGLNETAAVHSTEGKIQVAMTQGKQDQMKSGSDGNVVQVAHDLGRQSVAKPVAQQVIAKETQKINEDMLKKGGHGVQEIKTLGGGTNPLSTYIAAQNTSLYKNSITDSNTGATVDYTTNKNGKITNVFMYQKTGVNMTTDTKVDYMSKETTMSVYSHSSTNTEARNLAYGADLASSAVDFGLGFTPAGKVGQAISLTRAIKNPSPYNMKSMEKQWSSLKSNESGLE